MDLFEVIGKVQRKITSAVDGANFRTITSRYDLRGYKRIYLVHIRKTGGTSLNHSFLGLSGEDSATVYKRLAEKPDHRLLCQDKVYVGWNVPYINEGNYYYAFSHTPMHELNLPQKTFTLTCFRDPVQRVISHYNMLMDYKINGIDHPCMPVEGKWLGNSFDEFLPRIPKEHLCNQLYMFSAQYDIHEAVERVRQLSHYFFTERFESGIDGLNKKIGLNLRAIHIRKSSYKAEIPQRSIDNLREMVNEEYVFLNRIKNMDTENVALVRD